MANVSGIEATNRIRSRNRDVPQRTLATLIDHFDFPVGSDDHTDSIRVLGIWATIYTRIRRYDKATPLTDTRTTHNRQSRRSRSRRSALVA